MTLVLGSKYSPWLGGVVSDCEYSLWLGIVLGLEFSVWF